MGETTMADVENLTGTLDSIPRQPTDSAGEPVAVSGTRGRVLILSVIALVAGIAAATWIEQARNEELAGFLQARALTLVADRDAQLAEVFVRQGDVVEAGQPVLRLRDDQLVVTLENQRREVARLETEVSQFEAKLLVEIAWREKALDAELFETRLKSSQCLQQQFTSEIESLAWKEFGSDATQTAIADNSDQTLGPLVYDRMTPDERRIRAALRKEAARNSQEVSTAQLELCEQRLKQIESLKAGLPDKIRKSMGIDLVRSRLEQARADLARLEQQQESLSLTAAKPGLVGVFRQQVGDHVIAHQPIVEIFSEQQPYLIVRIPSSRLADFRIGTVVGLRFPGGELGQGRVSEIPPQTSAIPDEGSLLETTRVTAHIEPVGKLWPALPIGTTVEVLRKR
jgi:multidrug resistance efflux pump